MLRQVRAKDYTLLQQVDYDLSAQDIKDIVKAKKWWYLFEEESHIKAHMVYDLTAKFLTIERFYVDIHWRRNGIGTTMMYKLLEKLNDKRKQMIMSVEDNNLVGHLFLKDMGFRASINKDDNSIYDFVFTPAKKSV